MDKGNKRSKEVRQQLEWDDVLPDDLLNDWKRWKDSLVELQDISIPRCYQPDDFGQINHIELHAFSDSSKEAIGTAIYLRLIDQYGRVFVTLLFAQSKLSPKRLTTIPRLELCAAILSTQATKCMLRELTIEVNEIIFYTDSKVVLGYTKRKSSIFHLRC
jgi:hypothetical protein